MAQRIVNGRPVQTQQDARGLDYFINAHGEREYLFPAANHPITASKPKSSWTTLPDWDARTGTWTTRRNADGIATALATGAVGGVWAAPAISGVIGSAAAKAAAAKAAGGSMAGLGKLDLAMFGIDAGMKLWGANKASGASDRAAEIQAQAAREALAEARRQYDQTWNEDRRKWDSEEAIRVERLNHMAPYRAAGQAAVNSMADLNARTPQLQMPASVQARLGPSSMRQIGSGQTPMAASQVPVIGGPGRQPVSSTMPVGGQMVTLQAPTGETKVVPEAMAAAYIARGARRVA